MRVNQSIIEAIYAEDPRDGGGPDFIDNPVYRNEKYFWDDGELEQKINSWDLFKEELKHTNRFFPKETLSFDELGKLLKFRNRMIFTETLFRIRIRFTIKDG